MGRLATAIGIGALVVLAACSSVKPGGSPDGHAGDGGSGATGGTGGGGSGGGAGGGGGTVDPGPVCGDGHVDPGEECDDGNALDGDGCSATCLSVWVDDQCLLDQDCNADLGEICLRGEGDQFGDCEPEGRGCNTDAQCASVDPARCRSDGCYCRASAVGGETAGICWQVVPISMSCDTDEECGSSPERERPAGCVAIECGGGGRTLCMPKDLPGRACPPGYDHGTPDDARGDLAGFCVPPTGCFAEFCASDVDCRDPAYPACDLATGLCVGGCFVDPGSGTTIGCGEAKPACHAMPARLDADLLAHCETAPAYGLGRCGVVCSKDEDCAHRGTDVHGAPYVCRERGGQLACMPGGCVDDADCGQLDGPFRGFCDPWSQACIGNRCRLGMDPRAGCAVEEPYADCAAGFTCAADGSGTATGTCVPAAP